MTTPLPPPPPPAAAAPASPPAPAAAPAAISPSSARYFLALVWLLVGVAAAVGYFVWSVVQIANDVEDFPRMIGPGTEELELDDTGQLRLYYLPEADVDGVTVIGGDEIPVFEVVVTEKRTGAEVETEVELDDITFDLRGNAGASVYTFEVTRPGPYVFEVEARPGTGRFALSVGPSVESRLVRTILIASLLGAAGVIAAVVSVVRTAGARNRAKRKAAAPPKPVLWGPGAGSGPTL